MDPLLIDSWLRGLAPLDIRDAASVAVAREVVRARGEQLGLAREVVESLTLIASELGTNQVRHARGGFLAVAPMHREGVPGLEIVAADGGPGLADPAGALAGAAARGDSLGVGFSSVRRLAGEMDVDVRIGEGTCVRARRFAAPVRRRAEVGIFGRPIPGEPLFGDDAGFVRTEGGLLFALADGLGHGPEARQASAAAVADALAAPERALWDVLSSAARVLVPTRGAVMSVARVDEGEGWLEVAGVGNVSVLLARVHEHVHFRQAAGVLDRSWRHHRKAAVETAERRAADVLLAWSDGLKTAIDARADPTLLREPPIVIAQRVLERYWRGTDDGLVIVVR